MEKVTYKDIAKYLKKSDTTIKSWSSRYPEMLELTKLGAFCKKNNITIEDIKGCVKMKELAKDNN
jgi:hypothetical protein